MEVLEHVVMPGGWNVMNDWNVWNVMNGFKITSTSEKHMIEDNILFTNCLTVIMGLSNARG